MHMRQRPEGAMMMSGISSETSMEGQESAVEQEEEDPLSHLPEPEMECWRPTPDDVDRISWGKPAKKKMTGSRGVPHRLNECVCPLLLDCLASLSLLFLLRRVVCSAEFAFEVI